MRLFPEKLPEPVDDASMPLTILDVRRLRNDPRVSDPLMRLGVERAIGNFTAALRSNKGFVATSICCGLVIAGIMFVSKHLRLPTSVMYGGVATAGLSMWFIMPGVMRSVVKSNSRTVVQPIVAEGICGSCGYDIKAQPEHDGLVQCPECETQWSTNNILREHQPESGSYPHDALQMIKQMYNHNQWRWPKTTKDHRSQAVPIASKQVIALMKLVEEGKEEQSSSHQVKSSVDQLLRMHQSAGAAATSLLVFFMLSPLWMFVYHQSVGTSRALARSTFGIRRMFWLLIGIVLVFGVGYFVVYVARTIAFRRISGALIHDGVCPSCAGPLHHRKPEPDGCITCPTCWAGWKPPSGSGA
ncbi:MAG: hypothetical protein H6815_02365 [Phycisphaeraceae bacterium]|nr:hypothetical protein [Phycisphaerales bacterium]MCB9859271.1 hypothetical protein [Phycisphaeraceae bacterium]